MDISRELEHQKLLRLIRSCHDEKDFRKILAKNISERDQSKWQPETIDNMVDRLFSYAKYGETQTHLESETEPREALLAKWLAERSRTVLEPKEPDLTLLEGRRQTLLYIAIGAFLVAALLFFTRVYWLICLITLLAAIFVIFVYDHIIASRIADIEADYQQALDKYQAWHQYTTGRLLISRRDYGILCQHEAPLNPTEFARLINGYFTPRPTLEYLNSPGEAELVYDRAVKNAKWWDHCGASSSSPNIITKDPEISDILRTKLIELIDPWLECLRAFIDYQIAKTKLRICREKCDELGWDQNPENITRQPDETKSEYLKRLERLGYRNQLLSLAIEEYYNTKFIYERLASNYDDLHHEIEQYAAIIASAKLKEKMSHALDCVSQTYIPKAKAEHALDLQESYIEIARDLIKKQALHQQDLEASRRELAGNDPLANYLREQELAPSS